MACSVTRINATKNPPPSEGPSPRLSITGGCGNPLQYMDTHQHGEKGGTRTILGDSPVLLTITRARYRPHKCARYGLLEYRKVRFCQASPQLRAKVALNYCRLKPFAFELWRSRLPGSRAEKLVLPASMETAFAVRRHRSRSAQANLRHRMNHLRARSRNSSQSAPFHPGPDRHQASYPDLPMLFREPDLQAAARLRLPKHLRWCYPCWRRCHRRRCRRPEHPNLMKIPRSRFPQRLRRSSFLHSRPPRRRTSTEALAPFQTSNPRHLRHVFGWRLLPRLSTGIGSTRMDFGSKPSSADLPEFQDKFVVKLPGRLRRAGRPPSPHRRSQLSLDWRPPIAAPQSR